MHFSFLAFFFGLVLYAASSGAAALAAGADSSWLWWSALLPIAASYWLSGILATSTSLHAMDRRLATLIGTAFSGATTVLVVALTVWVACRLGQWMPGNIAVLILMIAWVAGLLGLGLAGRLGLGRHPKLAGDPASPRSAPAVNLRSLQKWRPGLRATRRRIEKLQSPRLLQPMIATISARNGASFRRNQG